ncbi:response regulator [Paenibacillus sp. HB172176]|uniref:response regulator n=1 Tax=Paenibacillus sp. HB172176 TaxID=2493690 RepID=UPI00143B5D74|nr:response regulator [Paenibacillus sp. HB172176]
MKSLLVVDDVAIIADGLHDLFSKEWKGQVQVYKAYSVPEAFEQMEAHEIDIVVSDIRMPQYSGIDLLREIIERWPECKVIFLTSYHDFQFAREAVTLGVFDFILKTEGDQRLLQAVNNALDELRQKEEARRLSAKVQTQYKQALPSLQEQFLREMLQGMHADEAFRQAQFRDLSMPFLPDQPAFLAIARMDEWKQSMTWKDKALLKYAFKNIMEEYLSRKVRMIILEIGSSHLAVIWQPEEDGDERTALSRAFRFFYGTLETVQNVCHDQLNLHVSFIHGAEPASWEALGRHMQELELLLQSGVGLSVELLTTDAELLNNRSRQGEDKDQSETAYLLPATTFSLLPDLLADGQEERFFELFDELSATVRAAGDRLGPKLEAIHMLASAFIPYMNRRGLLSGAARQLGLDKWPPVEEDPDWNSHALFYRKLARYLFNHAANERSHGRGKLIYEVQQYVQRNLGGDLSLTRIGEHVHLNPTYLSRLYKQMTGTGLSDYIMEVRIAKARELLDGSSIKIHEIAEIVGYQSGIAFNRFFNRMLNISPQDYRRMKVERD